MSEMQEKGKNVIFVSRGIFRRAAIYGVLAAAIESGNDPKFKACGDLTLENFENLDANKDQIQIWANLNYQILEDATVVEKLKSLQDSGDLILIEIPDYHTDRDEFASVQLTKEVQEIKGAGLKVSKIPGYRKTNDPKNLYQKLGKFISSL